MTRKLWCLAGGLSAVVFECAFFSFFPVEFSKPDLAIPFIVYATFFLGPMEAFLTALLFAFVQEILSAGPAGFFLFSKVSLFLSCLFLKSKLYIESRYTFSLVAACLVLADSAIFVALSALAKGETKDAFSVSLYAVPNAIVNGFVSLYLFEVFDGLKVRRGEVK